MNTKGIGLGLVISEKIVSMFDGTIQVISEEGIGTEFNFDFVLSKAS